MVRASSIVSDSSAKVAPVTGEVIKPAAPVDVVSGNTKLELAIAWLRIECAMLGQRIGERINKRIGDIDADALAKVGAINVGGAWVGRLCAELDITSKSELIDESSAADALRAMDSTDNRKRAISAARKLRKGLAYSADGKANQNDRNLSAIESFISAGGYGQLADALKVIAKRKAHSYCVTVHDSQGNTAKVQRDARRVVGDMLGKRVTASMIAKGTLSAK